MQTECMESKFEHADSPFAMLIFDFATHQDRQWSNPKDATGTADPRRFKQIQSRTFTPEQRKLYDAIAPGRAAKIANSDRLEQGPLAGRSTCGYAVPGIGDCVQRLGEEIRFRSSLPRS